MTLRYCLYPLIGDKVYGFLGDAVDILSIVTTICGVCTSLGLGAMQVNRGLQGMQHGFYRGVRYVYPTTRSTLTPLAVIPGRCVELARSPSEFR